MSRTFRDSKRPPLLRKWTDADLTLAYQRAQAGVPVRQLADEADVNQGSLGRLLKRHFGYQPTPYRRPTLLLPENVAVRAYIAGIIDGEGSIAFLNKHWCIKVGMTHEPVIRWLHSFGGLLEIPDISKQLKLDGTPRKQAYSWLVHRHYDVIHLLRAVLPYLIVKRERAEHVLGQLAP